VVQHDVVREDRRHGRGVQVGAADARDTDLDEDLSLAGHRLGAFLEGDLGVRRQDNGMHGRSVPRLEQLWIKFLLYSELLTATCS